MYISIPPMMMSPDEEGNNVDKNKEEKNARQTSVVVHVEQILRSLCIHFDWGGERGEPKQAFKSKHLHVQIRWSQYKYLYQGNCWCLLNKCLADF